MYRQEDQDSKWFATPAMATNIKKAKEIDRRRAAATEELRCCGHPIHFVFILVGFSPCSHRLLFLLQTGQTSHTNSFGGGGHRKVWNAEVYGLVLAPRMKKRMWGFLCLLLNSWRVLTPTSRHNIPPNF
jgi:hypothetical protein